MNFQKIKFDYELIFFIIVSLIIKKIDFSFYYISYLFIILHEFAHILVASILNVKTKKITFSLCGCSVEMDNNFFKFDRAKDLKIKLAGPLLNLIMAICFIENEYIFIINIILFTINLLPIMPLDGFYILRDILNVFVTDNRELYRKMIICNNICIILIFVVGIIFCIKYLNFSLLLFIVYVTIINMQTKNNYKIWNKIKDLI